jgi:hypothetical protein
LTCQLARSERGQRFGCDADCTEDAYVGSLARGAELVDSLEEGLAEEQASTSESSRLAALARWVARAGTGHSDFTDVARDKYKHLAEV